MVWFAEPDRGRGEEKQRRKRKRRRKRERRKRRKRRRRKRRKERKGRRRRRRKKRKKKRGKKRRKRKRRRRQKAGRQGKGGPLQAASVQQCTHRKLTQGTGNQVFVGGHGHDGSARGARTIGGAHAIISMSAKRTKI